MNSNQPSFALNTNLKLWYLLLVGLLAIGLSSCADSNNEADNVDQEEISKNAPDDSDELFNAPFDGFDVENEVLVIEKPQEATSFTLPSGTTLDIPANTFVSDTGEPFSAAVEVSFREFRNAAEIIASGIPMRVRNEDGTEGWMQTAGMFELEASSGGQSAQIASGKAVMVNFVSYEGDVYDFWSFDKEANNWINQGEAAPAVPIERTVSEEDQEEIARLRNLTRNAPSEPALEEGNILGFTDLDVSHVDALRNENPVMLAYAGDDPAKAPKNNAWINKATWFKKKIHATSTPGIYELTLLGDSLYTIPVKKALTGADLERAKAKYASLMEDYEANLAMLKDREAVLKEQRAFSRTIALTSTGLYNYDILWKGRESIPLMADFNFEGLPNAMKSMITVYLITGDGRVVVGLPNQDWNRLRVDLKADNKMLAVLPNNKVALFPQSAFEEQEDAIRAAKSKDYQFNMSVQERDVSSLDDLQALLEEAG
jgi:hypothetical protein